MNAAVRTNQLKACGGAYGVAVRAKSKTSSNIWLDRQRKDPYVKLASKELYRARSAFKLIEIDDKYKFIRPGHVLVDVGAAPGSWTQVAVQRTNSNLASQLFPAHPRQGSSS